MRVAFPREWVGGTRNQCSCGSMSRDRNSRRCVASFVSLKPCGRFVAALAFLQVTDRASARRERLVKVKRGESATAETLSLLFDLLVTPFADSVSGSACKFAATVTNSLRHGLPVIYRTAPAAWALLARSEHGTVRLSVVSSFSCSRHGRSLGNFNVQKSRLPDCRGASCLVACSRGACGDAFENGLSIC